TMNKMQPLEYYLKIDYPVTVYNAPEGGYVAELEDLPGCITEGETLEEVFGRINDARIAWIEVAYEDGQSIPEPRNERAYSGKFMIRIPKNLHRILAEQADKEGVSLNQYATTILSSGSAFNSAEQYQSAAVDEMKLYCKQMIDGMAKNQAKILFYSNFAPQWEYLDDQFLVIEADEVKTATEGILAV
ncbi:toxin-antitoxin system HicB family antitoxin, partial [Chloroflexota bacterium]